jgi:hypothetical protein
MNYKKQNLLNPRKEIKSITAARITRANLLQHTKDDGWKKHN